MCLAAKNDILMVMSDVPKGKAIAKCFYVDKGDFYTVNQRICRLTAQEIEPLFLFYVLNRNRYFLAFDDGVKQTNLRKNEVLECPVGVPPVDYQRKVIEILEAFTAKIDLDYKQLNRLKIIKRGLMDDLLTGKVRTV
jgi:type I restriction enzyme S subunit